jgi:hypothetical protein
MKPSLTWKPFRDDDLCGVHVWEASETEKWYYSVTLKCTASGNVSFVASRMSTNDGLSHEDIGDLKEECGSLGDAKEVVEQWHTERYADNDTEFDEYGGNTAAREEFETKQWAGQFKCRSCGQPITDGYRIQGILHHGCELKCEDCAQTE